AFSKQPHRPTSRLLHNLFRLGIYQVLYLTHIPVPISVSETVEVAKEVFNEKIANLVNGLLRTVERNRDALPYPSFHDDPLKAIAIQYSHPLWLVEKLAKHYGVETTLALCKANNTSPPLIIRTNTLKTTRGNLIESLHKEGLSSEPTAYSPEGILVRHPADITRLSSFQKGWFLVQDEAAQLISYLVNPKPGEYLLDLCAAPGGKTTHLAQLMHNKGHIIAIDIRHDNIRLLKENQRRLGITIIDSFLADATRPLPLLKTTKLFDKVLLDIPCSGLGILRRHPDGKWRKSLTTIEKLKKTQWEIIQSASQYVKPGGTMTYSTCTLNPEENEIMIEEFLSLPTNDFMVENPLPDLAPHCYPLITTQGYLQTFPHRDFMDGFFGARLRKKS
ncbi:MAG TPA: 16S rRNA (cytosine(967)-C(5))-methyltransferase RsmB, partial [Thermodesulfobacteriota bacterium]|nr:16S rRNA (cytosine(967)-C(5))-methyltransferase RsmB [Thermodesulfobacteriota bacterium]